MLVCGYCKALVHWGPDRALHAGTQSILPRADTRLFLLATGKLRGRGFRVVGHLRYDHGRGSWDEWYLQLDDGAVAWVSEDGRELTLERAVLPSSPLPALEAIRAGTALALEDTTFTVRELARAKCVGGEGQLPFTILPGETYAYADLASSDGQRFATLEFDGAGRPTCFVGEVLDHEDLELDDDRPASSARAEAGQHIKCTNCSGALEVDAGREVETQVCGYCGAQLDLTDRERRVLGINPPGLDAGFVHEIGQAATFYGKRYEVCGRMLYQDGEGYLTREYLLHNAEAGYLWLVEEQGHYVLSRPTRQAPARDPFGLATGQRVKVGSTTFRLFEQGQSTMTYVEGALPWIARVGDRFRYADLVAPPQLFSAEADGGEVEYFHGRYCPPREVQRAFGSKQRLLGGSGVHAAQPFIRGPVTKLVMLAGGLFALINLVLAGWSLGQSGTPVFQAAYGPEQYLAETTSEPFALPPCKVIALEVSAPLENSWIAMDLAFVNEREEVVAEMDNAIEYYAGYEDGEHWTEGTRTRTSYYRAPSPGTYRMIMKGSGGSQTSGPPRGEVVKVAVYAGAVMTRYFIFALFLSGMVPVFEILRQILFERQRWAPVTGDGDDDEDD